MGYGTDAYGTEAYSGGTPVISGILFTARASAASADAALPSITVGVSPLAATATAVGVAPAITYAIGAAPLEADAAAVGVNPTPFSTNNAVGNPPEADAAGVGVAPAIGYGPNPLGANAVGVGVLPSVVPTSLAGVTPPAASASADAFVPTIQLQNFIGISVFPLEADAEADGINPHTQVFVVPTRPFVPINDLVIFETPRVRDRPPYLPDSSRRQVMLMRHFENRLRGISVWRRNDGTFCVDTAANYESAQTNPNGYIQDDPIGRDLTTTYVGTTGVSTEFANDAALGPDQGVPSPPPTLADTNVNYPWNPYVGSTNSQTPGSYAYNVNFDQTTQDFALNPYLTEWWEGAAENIVNQEEALILTAAGFGDCLRAAEQGTIGTINVEGYNPYTGSGGVFEPTPASPAQPPLPPPAPGLVEVSPNEADATAAGINPEVTPGSPPSPGALTATAVAAAVNPTVSFPFTQPIAGAAASGAGVNPTVTISLSPTEADATGVGVSPTVTFAGGGTKTASPASAQATGAGVNPTAVPSNTTPGFGLGLFGEGAFGG